MEGYAFPFISGDSHLETHPRHWTERVPAEHRARAPRVTRLPDGSDCWLVEGAPARSISWGDNYGGKGRQQFGRTETMNYDNTPGAGSAEQRLREQDEDGIAAEILFPGQQTGPRLWRSIADDNAYCAVIQAWNSWLAEDYCSVDRDRLVGLGVIPWAGVDAAVAELERCARLGFKGVVLGVFPSAKSHPMPEDDRFWAAAADLKMPIAVHVEFDRQGPRSGPLFKYPKTPGPGEETRPLVEMVTNAKHAQSGAVNAVQLLFAGVFDRFPSLRLFFAETQIGWIPHFMEQADEWYEWHRYGAERALGIPQLERKPSEYVREHCYWGFQYNPVGVAMRHHVGVERAIWATDFPHMGSEWPHTRTKVIERNFAGVPEEDVHRMVCSNVCDFFGLDEETYRD
jgi:predicted TIM-barrel fold metal-dependent hydrolase